jgi:hypothetical protein
LVVAVAIGWGLVSLRALTVAVPYLNDSSLHEQMVRVATAQLRAGHLPLTGWFPYLGEGSAQFLHYQSLPAIITGAAGLVVGPDVAFRWSLYLLLATWPLSVYLAARQFGLARSAAAAAAAISPFLASVTGVAYEQHAYVWIGYGVWTQLWAMWTLPLAWGFSWRAIREGRGCFRAVLLTALTVCLHFETGYLALSVLLLWPLVAGRPLGVRVRRAGVLLGASLLAAAWVIVPLLSERDWAAVNEPLQGTGLVNGYGADRVLGWLVSGQLLDAGRLPVVTVLAAVGLGLAWLAASADADARALLVALAVCLLLAFGRTTFGSLVDLIPGHQDLFFRRFMMGVQLAALLLAGRGVAGVADVARRLARRVSVGGGGRRWALRVRSGGGRRWVVWARSAGGSAGKLRVLHGGPGLAPALGLLALVAGLAPAWLALGRYDRQDSAAITAQRQADATDGVELDRLIAVIRRTGGGRTYAGMPSNWGAEFTVGAVPVFKYLESRDVDEVGYTLRTASLMTEPEYFFDAENPSDYRLFAVRYLILPSAMPPPVPARAVAAVGPYRLWTVSGNGYVQVGQIVGTLAANRADVGVNSIALLHSGLADHGAYLGVHYGVDGHAVRRLAPASSQSAVGRVGAQRADLADGEATATVQMRRPGVAVLSVSYDPGWTATVNGRSRPTRMVAPALVAVDVPAGSDRVVFRYRGYRGYPELLALSGLTLASVALAPLWTGRRRRRWR